MGYLFVESITKNVIGAVLCNDIICTCGYLNGFSADSSDTSGIDTVDTVLV